MNHREGQRPRTLKCHWGPSTASVQGKWLDSKPQRSLDSWASLVRLDLESSRGGQMETFPWYTSETQAPDQAWSLPTQSSP